VQHKNSFEATLSTNHGRPVNHLCEFKGRKRVKDGVNRNNCLQDSDCEILGFGSSGAEFHCLGI
jgi:hypothetical protein